MNRTFSWVFVATWVVGVVLVAWSETQPDGYLIHVRGISAPQPYSVGRVLALSAVMAVLTAGFWALARLWTRSATFAVILGAQAATLGAWVVVAAAGVLFSMHAPPAVFAVLQWLLLLGAVLLGLAFAMDVAYRRGQRAES